LGLTRILTGMRSTTLMKFPVAFCGGSKGLARTGCSGDGIRHAFEFLLTQQRHAAGVNVVI
jgi:hypothetical protein